MKKKTARSKPAPDKQRLLMLLTVMGMIIFVITAVLFVRRVARISSQNAASGIIKASVSQSTSNGVFEVTLEGVRTAEAIPGYFEIPAEHDALCVALKIKNISGSEKKFIPVVEVTVDGKISYPIEPVPTCGGIGGPLQPGEELSGELGFIIPKSERDLSFTYRPVDTALKTIVIEPLNR